MTLSDNTKAVLSMMTDVAILQNKGKSDSWGVLFAPYMNESGVEADEAFAISETTWVRVSDFGAFTYDRSAPFYHYTEEGFIRNQMSLTIEDIRSKIVSYKFRHLIRIPYGNLINFLYVNFPDRGRRSRVRAIIKPEHGQIDAREGLVLCIFDEEERIFKHPQINKPFVIDKFSKLSREEVVPGKIYVCQVINQTEDFYIVNVKHEYFRGIQVGLYETIGGGFFPDERELYAFENYPRGRVLSMPFMVESDYNFSPVHLDCNLLMDALKLFSGGFQWVDIHLGEYPVHPIMITGVKEDPSFPIIQCYVAPLNPKNRGDIR